MSLKLSILIASTLSRKLMTRELLSSLEKQTNDSVEILIDWSEINSIGKKRNDLLNKSTGDYVVFVDSDDEVSNEYVSSILNATKSNSDCIGISGTITINGGFPKQWHISKDYGKWFEKDGVYYRTPNHISPVKREIALKARFPEISFGEDYKYSMNLLPYLNTETKIEGNIYTYIYQDKELI